MNKNVKNEQKTEENEDKLIEIIKNDEKLREKPDFRFDLIAMATLFISDFANNLYKTSIELNSLGGMYASYSIDAWKDFLNYPIIRKYIQSYRDEKINMVADVGLSEGDKSAVNIKKAIKDGGPAINNSNIVLIRLPEKRDFDN